MPKHKHLATLRFEIAKLKNARTQAEDIAEIDRLDRLIVHYSVLASELEHALRAEDRAVPHRARRTIGSGRSSHSLDA
jgi:hypothetical protein